MAASAAATAHRSADDDVGVGVTGVLGGDAPPLDHISRCTLVVGGRCSAGISWWPTFSFGAPDRAPHAGSARLVGPEHALPADLAELLPAAEDEEAEAEDGQPQTQPQTQAQEAPLRQVGRRRRQLLHIDLTRAPPDEFAMGGRVIWGLIPFPFLRIRTTRLEGVADVTTGAVVLRFRAEFLAGGGGGGGNLAAAPSPSVASAAAAAGQDEKEAPPQQQWQQQQQQQRQQEGRPPTRLQVDATLTTEAAAAFGVERLRGARLRGGALTLVSAAEVPKVPGAWLANCLLGLPAVALAVLPARLEFA